MVKVLRALSLIFLLAMVIASAKTIVEAESPHVDVITVEGAVNPPLSKYIERGIKHAEDSGAEACVIELDTPGGLLSSTQDITNRIIDAKVPVVVYVSRWAGSAGTFITLSAHVAAIAPGSTIGAAHPVGEGGKDLSETMDMKVTEDSVARIRSYATMNGRNVEAAEATVRKALSFSDQEALGLAPLSQHNQEVLGVSHLNPPLVDVGATSLEELVQKLEQGITLANGSDLSISPGAKVNRLGMNSSENFLYAISDPNIAYILLSLGMLGLLAELFHPGMIFPGVLGGICIILGIYSLDMLEANWAGLLLILLAVGLFVAEAFTPTFGVLAVGGLVSLIVGSLVLFGGTPFEVDRRLIAAVALAFVAGLAYITFAIVRSNRKPAITGREALIGQTARVLIPLDPAGTVFVEGERWSATAEDGRIEQGEEVVVKSVKGLRLWVSRKPT